MEKTTSAFKTANNDKIARLPNSLTNWHFPHFVQPTENLTTTTTTITPKFNDYANANANFDNDDYTIAQNLNTSSTTTINTNSIKLIEKIPLNLRPSGIYTRPNAKWMGPQWKHYDHLAHLSCDSGEMILRLNFSEPFKGIVYPDRNRLSPCRFFGDGHHNYELRLPLRGCGTRQAAPRIFVNDVIVRFHKTLELEEDEVKTLICRYPPPLAAGNSIGTEPNNNLAGYGVQQASPGRNPTNTQLEQEAGSFEFIDPLVSDIRGQNLGKFKPEREPGTTGNIETLSENLIVAPGQQQLTGATNNDNLFNSDPYGGGRTNGRLFGPQNNNNNNRLRDPTDAFRQRNSMQPGSTSNELLGSTINGGQRGSSSGGNFFERLSSIELLFLISSLMFLALLALGLAGSYYCFRRQTRRNTSKQVSAILRRKRRGGEGAFARAGPFPVPVATLRHYGTHPAHHQIHHQSSSSPESDVSNRGLLSQANSKLVTSGPAMNPKQMYSNQSDLAMQQHYLVPTGLGQYTLNSRNAAYGRASQPKGAPPPPVERKPGKPGAVVGRREASNYGYGYSTVVPRPARQRNLGETLVPPLIYQGPTSETLRAKRRPELPFKHNKNEHSRTLRTSDLAYLDGQQHHQIGSWAPHDNRLRPAVSNLWRAKSLASVTEQQEIGPRQRAYMNQNLHQGGTLKPQKQTTSPKHYQSQAKFFEPTMSEFDTKFSDRNMLADGSLSDSGDETHRLFQHKSTENNLYSKRQIHKPHLVLKSIEDSYITNFTEIYEQEYKKRDSMKLLSFEQWRAAQPKTQTEKSTKSSSGSDSSENDDDDDGNDYEKNADQRYLSTQTNLRSLTELDVSDYAKLTVTESKTPPITRPSTSDERLLDMTIDSEDQSGRSPLDSDTQVTVAERKLAETKSDKTTNSKPKSPTGSDDLILSPDYEYQPVISSPAIGGGVTIRTSGIEPPKTIMTDEERSKYPLKLELDSQTSHNSVSYV